MIVRGVLQRAASWVEGEMERAQRPFQDPFRITSLAFAISNATSNPDEVEETRRVLRAMCEMEGMETYDVVASSDALYLIGLALG